MTMKAVVLRESCEASALYVEDVPIPEVKPGWVLVKVKAFGLNRSELFTRMGESPSVKLPRILGIECAGEIANPSDSKFTKGQRVVSLMGGLGREFDGSYAEYALIPATQVYPVHSTVDWPELAAIPEMYYTAFASLFKVLNLQRDDSLLIRGGTSSVGIAATQLAKSIGVKALTTTRRPEKVDFLRSIGADTVLIDDGTLGDTLKQRYPEGVDKVLELVGTKTLKDSLQTLAPSGVLCMTGILGGEWALDHFEPMLDIKSGTFLTQFDSGVNFDTELLTRLFDHIERHNIVPPIAHIFTLDQISSAHILMESNIANGKIVVVNAE